MSDALIKQFIQHITLSADSQHLFVTLIQTLEFAFGESNGKWKTKSNLMMLLERYLATIRKNSQIKGILKGLVKQRKDILLSEQEGFYQSEEDSILEEDHHILYKDPAFHNQVVQETITQRDQQIKELSLKLKHRDAKIKDLATGYLKDLQNMREQLIRKDNDFEYYEVQYFDITDIEDPKYLDLVNARIGNLKSQYEKRTYDLIQFLNRQKIELKDLKTKLDIHEQRMKSYNNLTFLVNKIFQMESNPYVVWKQFEDAKGNEYFFTIFEKQKQEYGINYREINRMLMQTKAYDRELEYFKKSLEDQMCIYLERAITAINTKSEDYEEQLAELRNQLTTNEEIFEQYKRQLGEDIDAYKLQCNFYLNQVRKNEDQLFVEKAREIQEIEKIKLRYALRLWSLCIKDESLKSIVLQRSQDKVTEAIHEQTEYWKQQCLEQMIENQNKIQIESQMRKQLEVLQSMNLYDLVKCEQMTNEYQSLKHQVQDERSKNLNITKLLSLVMKFIDPKLNLDTMQLNDPNRETTKAFKDRVHELKQMNKMKYIENIVEQAHKNSSALGIIETHIFTQGTQTFNLYEQQQQQVAQQLNELRSSETLTHQDLSPQQGQQNTQYSISKNQNQINMINTVKRNTMNLDKDTQTNNYQIVEQYLKNTERSNKMLHDQSNLDDQINTQQFTQQLTHQFTQLHQQGNSKQTSRGQSFDLTQSLKSAMVKKRYISKENIADIQQVDSDIQDIDPDQKIHERLYKENQQRQIKIKRIKEELQQLETQHWKQVVQLAQDDQQTAIFFSKELLSSKHFYERQLKQNIQIQQKCYIMGQQFSKTNRAQFYYKKFQDHHINQIDETIQLESDGLMNDMIRTGLVHLSEKREKINFSGMRRDEVKFFEQLERNKEKLDKNKSLFRSTFSPRYQYKRKPPPMNLSYTSHEITDVQHKISKNIYQDYQFQ